VAAGDEHDALRTVYRSRSQLYAGVGFGVLLAVLGLLAALRVHQSTGEVIEAVIAVTVGVTVIALAARPAVIVDDREVEVRNPLSQSIRIPWSEIRKFSFGRHRLLNQVCMIELRNGATVHASAIQMPRASRNPAASPEVLMIAALNRRLAERLSELGESG
jgi:Bacterial PH domain